MAQLNASSGASSSALGSIPNANVKRSKFDLSRIINTTADSGMIIPIDWFTTIPGDTFQLSAEVGLETLPTVTNVLTPYRVRVGYYYIKNSDCWQGWNTFITKGRSGNVTLKVPQVNPHKSINYNEVDYVFDMPHSLSSFLGDLPLHHFVEPSAELPATLPYCPVNTSSISNYHSVGKLSALPFVMYQNICKYYFAPSNLLQDNTALFPEQGDEDWRLPYHIDNYATDNLCNSIDGKYYDSVNNANVINGIYSSSDEFVNLLNLRYACFDDDYFTSGFPWLERGSSQTMDFSIDFSTSKLFDESFLIPNDYSVSANAIRFADKNGGSIGDNLIYREGWLYGSNPNPISSALNSMLGSTSVETSITANNLRNLISMSVWQERNGRVDGSYNSMIKVHWNTDPNNHEHKARFIGGFSSYIDFSQVFQTSENGDASPLGSSAGRGSLYAKNNCGSFRADDYGMVMAILVITPITTYNTATDRELWCNNVMEDYVFPEFENLSLQPIYNGEIFAQGNDQDKGLFAYQERYSYLKSRYNVNRGLFRLPASSDLLFSSATQSRDFTSLPQFSYQFMVQSFQNSRRDWLAFMSEPMFKIQFASKVDAVRPLAYTSVPNTFGF